MALIPSLSLALCDCRYALTIFYIVIMDVGATWTIHLPYNLSIFVRPFYPLFHAWAIKFRPPQPPSSLSCSSSLHYPILAFLFYAMISNGLKPFAFPSTNNEQKDYGRVN